jgi:hypothetical protein
LLSFDKRLQTSTLKLLAAAAVLAVALWFGELILGPLVAPLPRFRSEAMLLALAVVGMIAYVGAIMLLFDRKWFSAFRGRASPEAVPPAAAT